MKKTVLSSPEVNPPAGDYSHGWKIQGGELVILSGQIPEDAEGTIVGVGDFEAQAEQVFKNIGYMLEAGGAGFEDIVKMQVFLTEGNLWKPFSKVRKKFLKAPFPATTLLIVKGLAKPEWMVEIEAMAVVA